MENIIGSIESPLWALKIWVDPKQSIILYQLCLGSAVANSLIEAYTYLLFIISHKIKYKIRY